MLEQKKRSIRIKAAEFRTKCKVSRYGIIDLFRDCERLGYKLIRYPLGELSDLGFVTRKDKDIIIFTNTCSRLSRELFTLAHEIGHAVLHMEDMESFIDDGFTISDRSMDEKEHEANYFAVCLLMPEDEINCFLDLEVQTFPENGLSAMDIARMMSGFSVSFDMVLNRLENLGIIRAGERLNLDSERNQKRVGNLLRSVGGNAKLNIPSNDITIPYEYIDYVIYNYNHNAIPMETLERALGYYRLSIEDIRDKLVYHEEADADDLDELIGELAD